MEGLAPDISSYNGAMGACAKAGQWRIGLELLAKVCRYHGFVPDPMKKSTRRCRNTRLISLLVIVSTFVMLM